VGGIAGFDWNAAQSIAREVLTPEEQQIFDLLVQGKSSYRIARILRRNRSAIWFAAVRIREKLDTGAKKAD